MKKPLLILTLIFLFHWTITLIWLRSDARPPIWDMAVHQYLALNYYDLCKSPSWENLRQAALSVYPPLFHVIMAFFFLLFHRGPHVAVLANMPAHALLLFTVYMIGCKLYDARAGLLAALLVTVFPFMTWMSRETIIDFTLAAMVSLSILLLIQTEDFSSKKWSVLFGFSLGLGMLTKWHFITFLILPIARALYRGKVFDDKPRLRHACIAALIGIAVSAPWYLPNLKSIVNYFSMNYYGALVEGDPPVFSLESFIYYFKILEGYHLFAVFFLVFCVGLIHSFFHLRRQSALLWVWLAGGWIFLTLLRNKDPRYILPLLPAVALISAGWIERARLTAKTARPALLSAPFSRIVITALIFVALFLQYYMINFGLAFLPEEIIIKKGAPALFPCHWNLYTQHYVHELGPPKKENWWRLMDILRAVDADAQARRITATIGLVPDFFRLNAHNLNLYARYSDLPIRTRPIREWREGWPTFAGVNYAIMSESEQGVQSSLSDIARINQFIVDNHEVFKVVKIMQLPNRVYIRIYFIAIRN